MEDVTVRSAELHPASRAAAQARTGTPALAGRNKRSIMFIWADIGIAAHLVFGASNMKVSLGDQSLGR
jgi:hypothetical protein